MGCCDSYGFDLDGRRKTLRGMIDVVVRNLREGEGRVRGMERNGICK